MLLLSALTSIASANAARVQKNSLSWIFHSLTNNLWLQTLAIHPCAVAFSLMRQHLINKCGPQTNRKNLDRFQDVEFSDNENFFPIVLFFSFPFIFSKIFLLFLFFFNCFFFLCVFVRTTISSCQPI